MLSFCGFNDKATVTVTYPPHALLQSLHLSVCLFIYLFVYVSFTPLLIFCLSLFLSKLIYIAVMYNIYLLTLTQTTPITFATLLVTFRSYASFIICKIFNYLEHQLTLILNWLSSTILPLVFFLVHSLFIPYHFIVQQTLPEIRKLVRYGELIGTSLKNLHHTFFNEDSHHLNISFLVFLHKVHLISHCRNHISLNYPSSSTLSILSTSSFNKGFHFKSISSFFLVKSKPCKHESKIVLEFKRCSFVQDSDILSDWKYFTYLFLTDEFNIFQMKLICKYEKQQQAFFTIYWWS